MRITGGSLGGRRVRVPGKGVRPTQDRVRESLFGMLGVSIEGCRFLDLFAGSGAVGLEALSRGATQVTWVESGRKVWPVLTANIDTLGGDPAGACRSDVLAFLKQGSTVGPFDIVYADPPYAGIETRGLAGGDLQVVLLDGLGALLADGGLFILEQGARTGWADAPGWERMRERTYGETHLGFFKRSER